MKDKIYRSANNPIKPFEFNDEVADVFPDMILRSVPGYPLTIKRKSLEDVLIPEKINMHLQRLSQAGFKDSFVWLKCFNFASLIAFK
jgi:hypothetical protein